MKTLPKRLGLLAGLFLLAASLLASQDRDVAGSDVLYLEEGDEILGTLIEAGEESLVFRPLDGEPATYSLQDVQRVELARSASVARTLAALGDADLAEWIRTAPDPEDFPGRDAVFLANQTRYTVRDDGAIERRRRIVFKVLTERGKRMATRKLSFFPDIESLEILTARSIAPDGTVADLAHTAMKEVWPNSRHPAYNRRETIVLAIPNAVIGSVIELEYVRIRTVDENEQPWYRSVDWYSWLPVLRHTVILDRPVGSPVEARELNAAGGPDIVRLIQGLEDIYPDRPTGIVATSTVHAEGRLGTTWTATNQPVFEREPYQPNPRDLFPRLVVTRARTWTEVGEFFHQAFTERAELDEEARAYVHRHTDGKDPETAAHDLYGDLVFRVRSVDLGPDNTSYLPDPAPEIFRRGYATGWDKTFLYWAMLREAGLPARLLAVGSWRGYRAFVETPGIRHFKALVVELETEDGGRYVTCDDDMIPFGELEPGYWSGDTLSLTDEPGTIGSLPPLPAAGNRRSRTLRIRVDARGNARVEESRAWDGAAAHGERWLRMLPDPYFPVYFEREVREILPNANLVSYEVSDRMDLDEPCRETIVYDVTPLAVVSGGRYLTLRLPGTGYRPIKAQQEPRRFDLSLGLPYSRRIRFEIETAEGVTAVGLPDAVSLERPWGRFSRIVEVAEDGVIIIEDVYERDVYELPITDYEAFADFLLERQRAGRQHLILETAP